MKRPDFALTIAELVFFAGVDRPVNFHFLDDLAAGAGRWTLELRGEPKDGKPLVFRADDKLAVVMPLREV